MADYLSTVAPSMRECVQGIAAKRAMKRGFVFGALLFLSVIGGLFVLATMTAVGRSTKKSDKMALGIIVATTSTLVCFVAVPVTAVNNTRVKVKDVLNARRLQL